MAPTYTGGNFMKIHRLALVFAALVLFAMPRLFAHKASAILPILVPRESNSLPASTVNCFAAALLSGSAADASGQAGDGFSRRESGSFCFALR